MKARKKRLVKGVCKNHKISFEALIVEEMMQNLLSVVQLTNKGNIVLFCKDEVSINNGKNTFKCEEINRLFLIRINLNDDKERCNTAATSLKTNRPITPVTCEGERFFHVLVDDYSHFTVVKLLKSKDEATQNLMNLINLIKPQKKCNTKRIRCDNSREFMSNSLQNFCKQKGIEIQYTNSYSPQQNEVAERMNRTLLDKV